MIIIAIEHCNGEIVDIPKIIDFFELDEYRNGPYLIYLINVFDKTIRSLKCIEI